MTFVQLLFRCYPRPAAGGHYFRSEKVLHPSEIKIYIFDLGADLTNRVAILDGVLHRRWTDLRGLIKWPPRSPNLTPSGLFDVKHLYARVI